MGLFTILLFIGIIILAVMALRFLAGIARTVISLALFVLAAGLLISLLTGNDLLGIGPTMGGVVNVVNASVS